MTRPIQPLITDQRLDRLVRQLLTERAGDVAADAIAADAMAERIAVRLRPSLIGRRWVLLAAAALLVGLLAGAIAVGSGLVRLPVIVPPEASPAPTAKAHPWWLWQVTDGTVVATDTCGEAPEPPGCAGVLTAGTHSSVAFDPRLTFSVPSGWINGRDWSDDYSLFPDTPFNRAAFPDSGRPGAEIAIRRLQDTTSIVCNTPRRSPAPTTGSTAEIVDWLAGSHGVHTDPVPVTINGLTGHRVDIQEEPDWACQNSPLPPSAVIRNRVIVLATPDGHRIAIHIRIGSGMAEPGSFEPFLAAATPIVESFVFDVGTASP